MKAFIFMCMLFAHIVDDFYLQGILAKMKQKDWWKEQTDDKKYRNDWIPALIAHGVSWAFMIQLPIGIYFIATGHSDYLSLLIPVFILNVWIHCDTDNDKCNKKAINLVMDQTVHLFQIIGSFVYFCLCTKGL